MDINIRQLESSDLPALQQLLAELGYPLEAEEVAANARLLGQRGGMILVAARVDRVVGCIAAGVAIGLAEGCYGEIVSLVVTEHCRGLGIGRRLIEAAETWLRPRVNRIRIRANTRRTAAHLFYRSLGYQEQKTQLSFWKYLL